MKDIYPKRHVRVSQHQCTGTIKRRHLGLNFAGRLTPFIPGGPKKEQSIQSIFQNFALINSYLFFNLLDRASLPHYNNTKIIKFGWEVLILWVISYGLSFSGFARFPEFRYARLMTASAAHAPTHTSIQPATKKSQCQWRAWIVNPC